MVVGGDELDRAAHVGGRAIDRQQRRDEPLEQQAGRGRVAVVDLVAHVQRLRHDRPQLDAAERAHRGLQHLEQLGAHPAQAVEHVGAVGAEAQHLAEALVEVAVGAVAGRRVLDDEQRHRRADDPGHRADRAVVVAGLERDLAAGGEHGALARAWRPSPRRRSRPRSRPAPARTCPPTRSAGRRAGCAARRERRDRVAGEQDVDEHGLRLEVAARARWRWPPRSARRRASGRGAGPRPRRRGTAAARRAARRCRRPRGCCRRSSAARRWRRSDPG